MKRRITTPLHLLLAATALVAPGTAFAQSTPREAELEARLAKLEAEMQSLRADLASARSDQAATAAVAQDKTKVGFIYVGPVGDGGWTYEHDQGRLALEEEFGDMVETVYQENVPEGADAERAITQMALSGADLIFTTSFGFMDPTIAVAEKFPDVKFRETREIDYEA